MLEQQEKLWDYDAVEPGQAGGETVVQITAENIAEYATVSQNPDARYRKGAARQDIQANLYAMPTMVITYAPLLREEIARANGFVAQEQSTTARRQTPFAKCEARWFHPVKEGDTITGARSVLEKYERRGSKFVTFRVQARNQHGDLAAQYDYTCIFEYSEGQRAVPNDPGTDEPKPLVVAPSQGRVLSFDSIEVGDQLATLDVTESQEVILAKNDFRLAGTPSVSNIHTDEEFARKNLFGGAVNSGPASMSYLDQMLELSFPLRSFYHGGRLLMRAITPFRAGDTVTFQGEITGKRTEGVDKIVECRVRGINQRGDLVNLSDAVFVLPE
ncbi:MAG: hypothetical protein BZY80_00640 [SAR202 cluster bacterium Io17-Chloro-G2]|nr:MAG: hypothetical protein BZY80_00640 [SAR202 cluster bacterium Io17-Chloro-G2]